MRTAGKVCPLVEERGRCTNCTMTSPLGIFPFVCRKTLQLSRQLRDQVMEAQACYSLGNTYTLLQQYERAVDYHLKHLYIAQELTDRWGVCTTSPSYIHTEEVRFKFSIFYLFSWSVFVSVWSGWGRAEPAGVWETPTCL